MKAQLIRNRAIRLVRAFFSERNLLEVRTPKVVRSAALEPYIDTIAVSGQNVPAGSYLATSPEFGMKKIFGMELEQNNAPGIYEIAPVFRDDPAGKNHAIEFTMVEWYRKSIPLDTLLHETVDCIAHIASSLGEAQKVPGPLAIFDIRSLFEDQGIKLDFSNPACFAQKYEESHGSLPQHLDSRDLAIVCFNLLFDTHILPWLKSQENPVAVFGYPESLGALAYCDKGVAERAEIYWHGMELANAYREEWRADIARERWEAYNAIRILRGVQPHAVDQNLLLGLPGMQGSCGVAVGLERVLARIFPALNFLV